MLLLRWNAIEILGMVVERRNRRLIRQSNKTILFSTVICLNSVHSPPRLLR
jgi:hypothetical protein